MNKPKFNSIRKIYRVNGIEVDGTDIRHMAKPIQHSLYPGHEDRFPVLIGSPTTGEGTMLWTQSYLEACIVRAYYSGFGFNTSIHEDTGENFHYCVLVEDLDFI